MDSLSIELSTTLNGFTFVATITARIYAEIEHEDERGKFWKTECVWRETTTVPSEDVESIREYEAKARESAEAKMLTLQAK
jgi:hypothetical protein